MLKKFALGLAALLPMDTVASAQDAAAKVKQLESIVAIQKAELDKLKNSPQPC